MGCEYTTIAASWLHMLTLAQMGTLQIDVPRRRIGRSNFADFNICERRSQCVRPTRKGAFNPVWIRNISFAHRKFANNTFSGGRILLVGSETILSVLPGEQRQEACRTIATECSDLIKSLTQISNSIQINQWHTLRFTIRLQLWGLIMTRWRGVHRNSRDY